MCTAFGSYELKERTWQPEKAIVEGDVSIDLGLEGVKHLVPQRDQTGRTFIRQAD